jgi:hypothetical protein
VGEMANDGDLLTFWQSLKATGNNKSLSEWIEIDLGQVSDINQVILRWDTIFARSYDIQVSLDQANWTTIYSTNSGDGNEDIISINNIAARYIMMYSTQWNNSSFRLRLSEFEVMGYVGIESVSSGFLYKLK